MRPWGWRAVIITCWDVVVFFISWVHQINAVIALWEPTMKCRSVSAMLLCCVWMHRATIRWGWHLGWWILYLRLWRCIWCISARYRMAQALIIDRRGIFIDVVLEARMNFIEVLGQSTSAFELSIASWTENKQRNSLERLWKNLLGAMGVLQEWRQQFWKNTVVILEAHAKFHWVLFNLAQPILLPAHHLVITHLKHLSTMSPQSCRMATRAKNATRHPGFVQWKPC